MPTCPRNQYFKNLASKDQDSYITLSWNFCVDLVVKKYLCYWLINILWMSSGFPLCVDAAVIMNPYVLSLLVMVEERTLIFLSGNKCLINCADERCVKQLVANWLLVTGNIEFLSFINWVPNYFGDHNVWS